MSALAYLLLLAAITLALLAIADAIRKHTRAVREIARAQAEERRQAGISDGFKAGWHGQSRWAQ